jgi:hypothetical protein
MREPADASRLRAFMRALGESARNECRVYLVGGATAVLEGWRSETIDADVFVVPDSDALLQAIPRIKEDLGINVELVSPAHFIPELPGWEERSRFIDRHGRASFFHYDFYAQALAKIERGEVKDQADVAEMLKRGLIDAGRAWELFKRIEPMLYRYPDLDPASFRRSVEGSLGPEPMGP